MNKVFLFVEIEVQQNKVPAFLDKLRAHVEIIRAENGCEFIELYSNSDNPNLVHVWEIWSNRPSWDVHMANSDSAAWREIAAEFVVGEKITVMRQA
jgi:autoinducer 2-degrading protein